MDRAGEGVTEQGGWSRRVRDFAGMCNEVERRLEWEHGEVEPLRLHAKKRMISLTPTVRVIAVFSRFPNLYFVSNYLYLY